MAKDEGRWDMGCGMWDVGNGIWALGKFEKEIIYTLLINIREMKIKKVQ